MRRPLIGLTGRQVRGAQVEGFPASFRHLGVDVYVADYAVAVSAAGGLPVHLPAGVAPAASAGQLDGLLLAGGADVDPACYGAEPAVDLGPIEPARDRFELGLLDLAAGEDLPILGICRGLQLLNVWAGGTLQQHVPDGPRSAAPGDVVEDVEVAPGSRLAALHGGRIGVNSLHHQRVDRVAAGWAVTGRGPDGGVEAMEWPDHDVLGVQWHPELLPTALTDPLFGWLVERAAERAGRLPSRR